MKTKLPSVILVSILFLLIVSHLWSLIKLPSKNSFWDASWLQPGYQSYSEILHANTIAEYKTCLQLLQGDNSIVTYDALKGLGSFESFVPGGDWRNGDCSEYIYMLTDHTGYTYTLIVSHKSTSKITDHMQTVSVDPNTADLRRLESDETAIFWLDNIGYLYSNGKLTKIHWNSGTYWFILETTQYDFENVTSNSNTFPSKLINMEAAHKAIASFNSTVQRGAFIRQTRFVRIALQGLLAVLMFVWGILQKKNVPKFCKKALQIGDEDKQSQYLRSCGKLKFLLAAVFAVMALVEFCEPVFFSAFLLLYGILLGLAWWQQRLINKEAFAVTDPSAQCASE